eukprot:1363306-Prymnesium_polylepis.1
MAKGVGARVDAINPLTRYGAKAQRRFGSLLRTARATRRLLTWREPRLTFWLVALLLACAACLALLPWEA